MNKLLCSTGALIGKRNNRDYRLLTPLSHELTCDGYEFMMYSSWYDEVDKISRFLQKSALPIPVVHCEKHIGEKISRNGEGDQAKAFDLFEVNCRLAGEIGAGKIVIHLWDGLISDQNFSNNREAYARLQDIAERHGVDLLVENVVCNAADPMARWLELTECYPDIHFCFDTKMAAFHNQLDLLYKEEYNWLWQDGHIRHYHVNDYAGGYMDWQNLKALPLGAGNIDFDRFFAFIHKIGYTDAFTVESTAFDRQGVVHTDMLNECFQYIRDHRGRRMRNENL